MLLLNRRGYSFVVMCRACGRKHECENCAIALTHHKPAPQDDRGSPASADGVPLLRLSCVPFRNAARSARANTSTFSASVRSRGGAATGDVSPCAHRPHGPRHHAQPSRLRSGILARLHSGEINLLVGTQMIAKGHDIHGVTLVGVVGSGPRAESAGLSLRRASLSVADPGGGPRRTRRTAGTRAGADVPPWTTMRFASRRNITMRVSSSRNCGIAACCTIRLQPYSPMFLIEHSDLAEGRTGRRSLGTGFNIPFRACVCLARPPAPIARIKRIHRFHLILKAAGRKRSPRPAAHARTSPNPWRFPADI